MQELNVQFLRLEKLLIDAVNLSEELEATILEYCRGQFTTLSFLPINKHYVIFVFPFLSFL